MNSLQVAEFISQRKFSRPYAECGGFEKQQISKIIAGTVQWRCDDFYINQEGDMVFIATCSECGSAVQLPFQPDGKRDVFCNKCYNAFKQKRHEQLKSQISEFNRIYGGK